MLIGLR